MSPVEGDQTRKNASKNLIPYRNDQIDPVVLSKFLGHFVQVEIEEQLTSVSNETLIFWGEQDAFIQSEWGAKLDQLLPSSHFIEAPGEYHNIATVKPKILANAISEFVVSREDSDRLGHHSSRG
jgi:pimeloyl-ACP methyl ester carboxylesterase